MLNATEFHREHEEFYSWRHGSRRSCSNATLAVTLDHAAELHSDIAGLVHDNERRWRVVHERVAILLAAATAGPPT